MALTSTLYTGLSGLDVNQTKLNVVGNNIANVNTVGFKSSRVLFKPQFYVTDAAGAPPSSDFGGENPSQRGLGAVVASIEKNFSPGAIEPTGRATDMAIDGEGFFVVQGQEQMFTRDGSFTLNSENQLVTTAGDFVQGFGVDANSNIVAGRLQNITVPIGSLTNAKPTSSVKLEGNLNANGAIATGASILNSQALTDFAGATAAAPTLASLLVNLRDPASTATPLVAAGDKITIAGKRGGRDLPPLEYTVGATDTLADFADFVNQALGVDTSVVAPTGSPAPGVTVGAVTGDAANTGRIIITGNLGSENALSLAGTGLTSSSGAAPFTFADGRDLAGITSDPTGESVYTSFVGYDSLGTPVTVNLTAVLENKADTGNTWRFYATSADDTDAAAFTPGGAGQMLGTGTLTFDNEGRLAASTGTTLTVDRTNTGAISPLSMAMDFASLTSLTSRGSELVMTEQDGSAIGTLNSFSIGANGLISGSFSNGLTRTLGQVAVATFNNPQGLVDKGGNMYVSGANSGVAIVGTPLQLGAGSIRSGSLELSNVDLSAEFINLIVASTGFSAASRVITTSDQLLTELLNTSR
jgi:flagellar hook protein FlgE